MREIVLDTETTGLNPFDGHRIVEIGAVELWHQVPTGRTYHQYINPERDMPEEAFNVHGISEAFLADKPVFRAIAQAFIDFVEDSKLVIHNASFDMRFLNAELEWAGLRSIPNEQAIDTLEIARRRFPGSPASLDALVPAVRHRQFTARETRRVARLRNPRGCLPRADRRQAARFRSAAGHTRIRPGHGSDLAPRAAATPASPAADGGRTRSPRRVRRRTGS
jgi:DNA polymerase III epsilon subunit family exonuclease